MYYADLNAFINNYCVFGAKEVSKASVETKEAATPQGRPVLHLPAPQGSV